MGTRGLPLTPGIYSRDSLRRLLQFFRRSRGDETVGAEITRLISIGLRIADWRFHGFSFLDGDSLPRLLRENINEKPRSGEPERGG